VQTLDFFHACQHLHRAAERIFGEDTSEAKKAYQRARGLLVKEGWQGICQWVGELYSGTDEKEVEKRRPAIEGLLKYFSKHVQRLNYVERLRAGRAIGSGQVEGKAKTLGLRLKLRGARWNRINVQPMASLVCVRHSRHQWDAYWHLALAA
jgi:hypothetical protein